MGKRGTARLLGPEHVADADGVEWVTTAAAVRLLGPDVTAAMIYDWVRRGLVQVAGRDGPRSVYRLEQLQDAERRARTRGRKRSA